MINYNRKIIRAPKGTNRCEIALKDIKIPDLWHIAMTFREPVRGAILETWHLAHDLLQNLAGDVGNERTRKTKSSSSSRVRSGK